MIKEGFIYNDVYDSCQDDYEIIAIVNTISEAEALAFANDKQVKKVYEEKIDDSISYIIEYNKKLIQLIDEKHKKIMQDFTKIKEIHQMLLSLPYHKGC